MTDFFLPITENTDANSVPTILIDVSGSTNDNLSNNKSVRVYEFEIAKKILEKYKEAHVICWSQKAFSLGKLKLSDFDDMSEIYKKCEAISSGTYLVSGLTLIENSYYNVNGFTDIIIITDGELNDQATAIANRLKELSTHHVNLKIIAVEKGKKNYLTTQCEAGNTFYKMIRDNKLLKLVNKFLIYNELDTEFVNFSNPRVPDNYVPFREKMFQVSDLPLFVKYIPTLVEEIMVNDPFNTVMFDCDEDAEETEEEVEKETGSQKALEDRMRYIKLAHDISLSIFHLVRYSSQDEKTEMTTLFSNMFQDVPRVYPDIKKLIVDEVNNHLTGQSTMFVENI